MSVDAAGAPPTGPARRSVLWFAVDLLAVLVFAVVGLLSHGSDPGGFLGTAWPFVVGLVLAWLVPAVRVLPLLLWPTGVLVWASTTAVGLALRAITGGGMSGAFPWVTAAVLAVLLLGWRLVPTLARRRSAS